MSSEFRMVSIAPGQETRLRKSRVQTARPGYIRVEKQHRAPFDIEARRWEEAPKYDG